MNYYFNNRMFNPQYVNAEYFNSIQPMPTYQQQNYQNQNENIYDAVKAVHDLCKAVKGMDEQHQMIAFSLCLAEMAKEFGW